MDYPPICGVVIAPDNQVRIVALSELRDYQDCVGGLIEAVDLETNRGRFTMYVNEEYTYKFDPSDRNPVAMDVAGLGGRADLLIHGILGPVVCVGPPDDEGYSTTIPWDAVRMIEFVLRSRDPLVGT